VEGNERHLLSDVVAAVVAGCSGFLRMGVVAMVVIVRECDDTQQRNITT